MKIDFEKISWQQILTLCRVIHLSTSLDLETITRWYNSESVNFKETLEFLEITKVIKIKNNKLILIPTFKKVIELHGGPIKQYFIDNLFRKESNLSKYFGNFFDSFERGGNSYRLIPTTKERLRYSGVRNFLITLGVLKFDPDLNGYSLEKKLIFYLILKNKVFTYRQFEIKSKLENEIGFATETLIYKLERNKFKNKMQIQAKVRHISLENVMAGYDIKSFELQNNKKLIPKYIEVKAVSPDDWKFYWSKNEIDKASYYSTNYYLYLVPVKKVPDISALRVIRDPYREVFLNQRQWGQEIESISFFTVEE